MQTGDNIVACVTKSGSDKSAEVHCPPLKGHGLVISSNKYNKRTDGKAIKIKIIGCKSRD